jgi:putative membrane protein
MLSIWHWHTEPLLLGGILAVVWIYAMLVGPLRAWIDPEALFPAREVVWFSLGVLSFYLAVGSPLDAAGENFLFSAHMVQHNILMYGTAVLTLLALPGWLIDGLLQKAPWLLVLLRPLVHPLIAGFLFTFVFSGWHVPVLYEWALHDKLVHTIEHLTMYGSSVLMLWPLLSRSQTLPASAWGVHILYLFVLMVAQIPLFGILTFAEYPFYPTYEYAPRVIAWLDPMQDQVLGGLLMKVANMVFSLIFIGRAFYIWNSQATRVDRRMPRGRMATV